MAPDLKDQLAGSGFSADQLETFQRDMNEISRLSVRSLLTEAEQDRAYRRLIKNIQDAYSRTAVSESGSHHG